MAISTGLVSVTFRKLSVDAIVELAKKAGIDGIEWGGDVHVKPDDDDEADRVRKLCKKAGIAIPSYGSYLRLGETNGSEMMQVLDTAERLGAKNVRVWPGRRGSAEADDAYRKQVADDLSRFADLAYGRDMSTSLEFHGNSLTDTAESCVRLLRAADHPAAHTYWQPPVGMSTADCLASLDQVLYDLLHLHVFHWVKNAKGIDQRPLAEGTELWTEILKLADTDDRDRYALLEFVRGESEQQFLEDAATLRALLDARK